MSVQSPRTQWLYTVFGACPASLAVERLFHLRSAVDGREEVSAR